MNVQSTVEAQALYQVVNSLLADHVSPSVVREAWPNPEGAFTVWLSLCQLGLAGLTRSPERGGGLSLEDLMPVLESAGRHAVPVPLVEIVGAACPVLAAEGSAQAEELLADVDEGSSFVTVQDGWRGWAPWAALSRYVIVLDGEAAVVCEPSSVDIEPLKGADPTRLLGRVSEGSQRWRLTQRNAAQRLRSHLLVSTAANLNGLSRGALDQAIEYAALREQFKRRIGSFQAVRHLLAAAYARLEFTRRYAHYAAWSVSHDLPDSTAAAHRAKAIAGDVSVEASYAAFQVHGGIGYTWECDLHLWMKRMQALDGAYGSSEFHWEALADMSNDDGSVER